MKNQLSLPSCLLVLGCIIAVSSVFGENVDNARIPSNEEKMKNLDALNERNGVEARMDTKYFADGVYLDLEGIMRKAMPMIGCFKCDSIGPCVPKLGASQFPAASCDMEMWQHLTTMMYDGSLVSTPRFCEV